MPTVRPRRWAHVLLIASLSWIPGASSLVHAQTALRNVRWQRIGTSALYANAPGVATGPVRRVWYSSDGRTLYVRTATGLTFETSDLETWKSSTLTPPGHPTVMAARRPEPDSEVITDPSQPDALYAAGQFVYRSEDGGQNWTNLTSYRQQSILGGTARDVAVSPTSAEEITVASDTGVWRSVDRGVTWAGLNQLLPNLPIRRLTASPGGSRGVQAIFVTGTVRTEMEWMPGEKQAWQPAATGVLAAEESLATQAAATLGATPTAVASSGLIAYAGTSAGRLAYSLDGGRTWQKSPVVEAGAPEAFYVDSTQPSTALVVFGPRGAEGRRSRVFRTINGGVFWDDLSDNLPDVAFHGITADRSSGTVYIAGDQGIYYTRADLVSAGPATSWVRLSTGLPEAPVMDVRLDGSGNQLYAALAGYGVYATAALRGARDLRVVSTADLATRIAAPGALMSVFGQGLQGSQLDGAAVPVLSGSPTELQIQVPFSTASGTLPLAIEGVNGRITLQMRLAETSPVIFLDPDGSPWLLNADTGMQLDAQHPGHAGSRLQILCTGLGRVRPEWPTGLAAPLADPPQVVAGVRVLLGDTALPVTRATLAPGYVGYYLVEVILPAALNAGPAELSIESDGRSSNRVRIYLEP